jgi:hypothetical protein
MRAAGAHFVGVIADIRRCSGLYAPAANFKNIS